MVFYYIKGGINVYIEIETKKEDEFIDITNKINDLVNKVEFKNGYVKIFVPHTTAGITINENADPDVKKDILKELNIIVPKNHKYKHLEGNSHAHIKASIMGSSVEIPFEDGRLQLGTWQGIYFCEFDGPRRRKYLVNLVKG